MITKIITTISAFLMFATQTCAYCEGGYPNISVPEEIKECSFVVVGTVISRMVVVDLAEDPEGSEAELFRVKIQDIISGKPKQYMVEKYLTLYNPNDSGRFPMDVGGKYIMFVYEDSDGYYISSCGNSVRFDAGKDVLKEISKAMHNKSPS